MDDFEKFIFLWLCLIVSLKAWAANNGIRPSSDDEPNDGWFINKYFSGRQSASLVDIFESVPSHTNLATRKSMSGDYVVQSSGDDKGYFSELYRHYKNHSMMVSERKAQAIGRALKAIRNNLFHGEKCYDSTDDQALVSLSAPILEAYVIDVASRDLGLSLQSRSANDVG